jgi:uncharacterized damage-inducible protein DinB
VAADRQGLIRRVDELHADLERTVRPLGREQLHWQPSGDGWSIAQVLAHIAEFQPFFVGELLRVKADPSLKWGRGLAHPQRLAAVEQGGGASLDELWPRVDAAHRQTVEVLKGLSDADLAIEAEHVNPKFGRQSTAWLVEHFITEHLEGHIAQIRRNLAAMGSA